MREFYRQREPQLTLQPVDMNALVQQVVDLTRARWSDMAQQRGTVIEMGTELAPDVPTIMGADNEIREALINLIFNAVDAMPDGGPLRVQNSELRRNEVSFRSRLAIPESAWMKRLDADAWNRSLPLKASVVRGLG